MVSINVIYDKFYFNRLFVTERYCSELTGNTASVPKAVERWRSLALLGIM